jgi:hypothetical protein
VGAWGDQTFADGLSNAPQVLHTTHEGRKKKLWEKIWFKEGWAKIKDGVGNFNDTARALVDPEFRRRWRQGRVGRDDQFL